MRWTRESAVVSVQVLSRSLSINGDAGDVIKWFSHRLLQSVEGNKLKIIPS